MPTDEPTLNPLPALGYTAQSEQNVALVNQAKRLEEMVMRHLDRLEAADDFDRRWVAIARTDIQKGFMAMNRAVFKPRRPTNFEMEN
jgi:hypothetical protein